MENIPENKPLVIASNHPTAFIEPCIYGSYFPIELHYMTRGDFFLPQFMWFFNGTNQIPIYRRKDGIKNLRKNKASFAKANEVLAEGGRVTIFPEATAINVRRIRRLKNGAARLIVGTEEMKSEIVPHIIAVAANYENLWRWRSYVFVSISEPFDPSGMLDGSESEMDKITDAIERNLRKQAIHIDNKKNDKWVNALLQVITEEWRYEGLELNDRELFHRLQKCAAVGKLDNIEKLKQAGEKIVNYNTKTNTFLGTPVIQYKVGDFLSLLAFTIMSIPAMVFLSIPYLLGKSMVSIFNFSKEFEMPVFLGSELVGGIVVSLVFFIILILNIQNWIIWVTLLILPFSILSFCKWGDRFQKLLMHVRFKRLTEDEIAEYSDLRQMILKHKLIWE